VNCLRHFFSGTVPYESETKKVYYGEGGKDWIGEKDTIKLSDNV
jgi:hypothetical protein